MGAPQPFDPTFPRLAPRRPFPPYRHVPGTTPHPRTDPAGHSFGRTEPDDDGSLFTADDWAVNETYLYGVDLYNYAFWWESHEQWELLWKPLDRDSREGLFLRGLIQASATLLKVHAGNARGVSQLFRRSRSNLMAAAGDGHHPYMGLEVQPFVANLQRFIETTAAGSAHDIADLPVIKLARPDGRSS